MVQKKHDSLRQWEFETKIFIQNSEYITLFMCLVFFIVKNRVLSVIVNACTSIILLFLLIFSPPFSFLIFFSIRLDFFAGKFCNNNNKGRQFSFMYKCMYDYGYKCEWENVSKEKERTLLRAHENKSRLTYIPSICYV